MIHRTSDPNPAQAQTDYSIGVVTYVARFEEFFQPLIRQLAEAFLDKEIVCIINGHPDKALQIGYLKHVTAFMANYPNVRYLTYEANQPLSKCFNWLLLMSFAPRMLILNDDISLNLLFRKDLETALYEHSEDELLVINGSWSHMVINKQLIKKVGWFEERLLATGQEDADYRIRMENLGLKVSHANCKGIINYVAPQKNAGWQNISSVSKTTGKYSSLNEEFFEKKFSPSGKNQEGGTVYRVNPGMETPMFYDLACLDDSHKFAPPVMAFKNLRPNSWLKILLPFQWTYSFTRKLGGRVYRFVKAKIV